MSPVSLFMVYMLSIGVKSQENAQPILAPILRECYNDPNLLDYNNLPPMSLSVLLDIIRKIEDYPGTVANMRQLSTGIIHFLRQDGIVYDPSIRVPDTVIPYSPTGFQSYKNRLLLRNLLPNNQFSLPELSLTTVEKCTLHRMVSSNIALENRGDEGVVCKDIIKQSLMRNNGTSARINQNLIYTAEEFDINENVDIKSSYQIISTSLCPIESGVVSTPWGTLSAGPLLAGISSGLEKQIVLLTDLVTPNIQTNQTHTMDNRYVSTLSGDLAEITIRQGSRNTIVIGAKGFWNSTLLKQHYFITTSDNIEMTDSEIIGDLDGLILSDLSEAYVDMFPEFKLSQYIDMYYSDRGILHDDRFKACNRRTHVPTIASTERLVSETVSFSLALNTVMPASGTLNVDGVEYYAKNAVERFYHYLAESIDQIACDTVIKQQERPKVNLILVTEPSLTRYPLIWHILESIDVSKFGSSITLMEPWDGTIIIDKTFSLTTFHQKFAEKNIGSTSNNRAINLVTVLQSLREYIAIETTEQQINRYLGGNSSVALILVENVPLTSEEHLVAIHHAEYLRSHAPDLIIIFATSSASESHIVTAITDRSNFLPILLNSISPTAVELNPAINRILEIPKHIVSASCPTLHSGDAITVESFIDFIDAGGINVYKLHSNYFYLNNDMRALRVKTVDEATLSVCYSRSNQNPRRNVTTSQIPDGVTCNTATSGSYVEINLMRACDGYNSPLLCPALYFTVAVTSGTNTPTCTEYGCRYPDDVKISIEAINLDCYGSGSFITSKFNLIITLSIFIYLQGKVNSYCQLK